MIGCSRLKISSLRTYPIESLATTWLSDAMRGSDESTSSANHWKERSERRMIEKKRSKPRCRVGSSFRHPHTCALLWGFYSLDSRTISVPASDFLFSMTNACTCTHSTDDCLIPCLLAAGKPIPTELRREAESIKRSSEFDDSRTAQAPVGDEAPRTHSHSRSRSWRPSRTRSTRAG